jgi:uncharacterized protein YjbJ (UPF0337 family)
MSYFKKVYDKIKLFIKRIVLSIRGRLGYIWYRVKSGQEPIIVRGVVVLVVAVAAMFGQIIDPNVVLAVIIFLVPAAISARGQVSPAETKYSWLNRVRDLFMKAPIKDYPDGPVDPQAEEPNWDEEYQNLEDEFDILFDRYQQGVEDVVGEVVDNVEDRVEDAVDQAEDVADQVENAVDDVQDAVYDWKGEE